LFSAAVTASVAAASDSGSLEGKLSDGAVPSTGEFATSLGNAM